MTIEKKRKKERKSASDNVWEDEISLEKHVSVEEPVTNIMNVNFRIIKTINT